MGTQLTHEAYALTLRGSTCMYNGGDCEQYIVIEHYTTVEWVKFGTLKLIQHLHEPFYYLNLIH